MLSRAAVRTCLALALMAAGPALTPGLLAQEADDKPTPPPAAPAPPAAPRAKPAPAAQAPAPTPPVAYAPAVPGPPPPRRGQPVNVRIDAKITDLRGAQAVATKSVSLTVADGQNGSARTTVEAPYGKTDSMRAAYLKIDARPDIGEGQKINLRLSLDYNLIDPSELKPPVTTTVQESVSLLLESGQPLIVAESADPAGDRRVRLEVTATILR